MTMKAKSNSVITHEPLLDGEECVGILFHVQGAADVACDMRKLSPEVRQRAILHGMTQRISDAAAIARDPDTGESASAQDKFDAMKRLVAHYESGTSEWSRRPVAGEGQSGGLLFKALCILSAETKTPEEIKAWMATKTRTQLAKLRTTGKVAEVIESLRPVSLAVDTDALLDELN